MPSKCPACTGHGQAFQDDYPTHIPCGECAGTGRGEVAEAAREIEAALWRMARLPKHYAQKRRETIAGFVASAVGALEREAGRGDKN